MTLRDLRRLAVSLGLAATALAAAGFVPPASARGEDALRCTVVLDAASGATLHRQGDCDEAVYPQSTFKLPLAMMGFDAGVLKDAHTPRWDYQAKFNRPERERKATDPQIWERDSIVWYSQELTRRLGRRVFAEYVARLGYGNRDVSGGPGGTDGLTQSWLMSSLTISPDQQVDFLRRFLTGRLPISERSAEQTRAIVPEFAAADGWTVYGKTGAGSMRRASGEADGDRPIGWFVGWAQKGDRTVVFARLLVDTRRHPDKPISYTVRDALIADLPGLVESRPD